MASPSMNSHDDASPPMSSCNDVSAVASSHDDNSPTVNSHGDDGGKVCKEGEAVPQSKEGTLQRQDTGDVSFCPPLNRQRYMLVWKVLKERNIRSVVDFGSANCKIFMFLKNPEDALRQVALVDLERGILEETDHVIDPLTADFVFLRPYPLTVSMLQGNAGQLDSRVTGFQAASLVEMYMKEMTAKTSIEHLEPDVLQQVTNNVFGRLRPSTVIVTTPNSEYNVVFPNHTGFRHWDHKFEWTREEFKNWCEGVCQEHGYTVEYTGVGEPPEELSHVGFCSQVAIFTESLGKAGEKTEDKPYELVKEVQFPYDKRTRAERLAHAAEYALWSLCKCKQYQSEDESMAIVPVWLVHHNMLQNQDVDGEWPKDKVVEFLQNHYSLIDDETYVLVQLPREEDELSDFGEEDYLQAEPDSDYTVEPKPEVYEAPWD